MECSMDSDIFEFKKKTRPSGFGLHKINFKLLSSHGFWNFSETCETT